MPLLMPATPLYARRYHKHPKCYYAMLDYALMLRWRVLFCDSYVTNSSTPMFFATLPAATYAS